MERKYSASDFRNLLTPQSQEEEKKGDAVVLTARFVDAIQRMMTVKGITQKELATMVDCTPSYLSQVFSWDKPLNMVLLSQILKKLEAEIVFELKELKMENVIIPIADLPGATHFSKLDYNANHTGTSQGPYLSDKKTLIA